MKQFLLLIFLCPVLAQQGKVIKVSDGDTFTILTQTNKKERIRLYGIDAPENQQPFSKNAQAFLSQLILGKIVTYEIKDTDRYNRKVAIVYLNDSINLNETLLKKGYAWHYKEYDNNPLWEILEQQARKMKLGLWSHNNAIAPWKWRKNKKTNK